MTGTSDFDSVLTRQQRIAELAKQSPQMAFTSLNQHLDLSWLYEAYRRTRKDGAAGVDGQTAADYEKDLEGNLRSLLERAKYGLTVHPEKTRLVPFRRPPAQPARKGQPPAEPPGTFDLLGFTHYWARSRKGTWVVKRKMARSRFTRAVTKIAQWCRINRHQPIAVQHQTLSQKLRGHFAYYGITGNSITLARFRQAVQRVWWEWLGRRRGGNRPIGPPSCDSSTLAAAAADSLAFRVPCAQQRSYLRNRMR